ncbi:MAG: hypothetical protein Q9195_005806 [Heterodermia aff. obscurata]
MGSPLSVGDAMMLGSLAWKIGCAFTSGRSGAPSEFREVENELKSLQESFTNLADTLGEDGSISSRADDRTKEGLGTILSSCWETLKPLEVLVNQYQELQKREGNYPVTTHRVWRTSVIRNYKKLLWTSEGGNIQSLRNMLQLHVGSINTMVTALQSQSLARLEGTIQPMASQIDGIHNAVVGNIDVRLAEIHNLMRAMTTPTTSPSLDPIPRRDTVISLTDTLVAEPQSEASPYAHAKQEPAMVSSDTHAARSYSTSTASGGLALPMRRRSNSLKSYGTQSSGSRVHSPTSTPYETPPTVFADSNCINDQAGAAPDSQKANVIPTLHLPQPAVATSDNRRELLLPSSTLVSPQQSATNGEPNPVRPKAELEDRHDEIEHTATADQQIAFERTVFDHALTLCTGVGVSVDYTQRTLIEESPDEERTKIVQAMQDCKISIVTKMRSSSTGVTRHITSIWAISSDRSVRLKQQLPEDDTEVVPYTVWGRTDSVVLRFPTELIYHDIDIHDRPVNTAKTSWVNYHFKDEQGSRAFQSALMWKPLLHSFCTRRTMLAHEGFVHSAFSFQEQLCGLENLRLWRDEEAGSTVAMIHYSPTIYEGYLSFRVSGPGTTAKIADDGERWVKVKKLNIVLGPRVGSASPSSPSPEGGGGRVRVKKIPAIRIEFSTPEEKYKFLEVCSRKG